jgi:hypothetical protein
MSEPFKDRRKWQGRVRKPPPVSEKLDSHEDADNFIIKKKAELLSMMHNDVMAVRETTIGALIESDVDAQ